MIRRPPVSTPTATLFSYPTLFLSARVDAHLSALHAAGERHRDHAAAGVAVDFEVGELFLHALHVFLHLLRLLHQLGDVSTHGVLSSRRGGGSNRAPASRRAATSAAAPAGRRGRCFRPRPGARRAGVRCARAAFRRLPARRRSGSAAGSRTARPARTPAATPGTAP